MGSLGAIVILCGRRKKVEGGRVKVRGGRSRSERDLEEMEMEMKKTKEKRFSWFGKQKKKKKNDHGRNGDVGWGEKVMTWHPNSLPGSGASQQLEAWL